MSKRITDERLARMIEMTAADTVIFAERKNRSAANYFKDVESALRELASLREQTRWIPVTERLPLKPNTSIVFEEIPCIVTDGERVRVVHYQRGGGHVCDAWAAWSRYGDIESSAITAWRPMPEIGPLPTGEGK